MMTSTALLGVALGMRHGADPDHLAAIDGLTRVRPRAMNGVYFALGHGVIVITLAVGLGQFLDERLTFVGPWSLILIGAVNLWRLLTPAPPPPAARFTIVQPFVLGMVLALGFETASQLSALLLAGRTNAWVLGTAFSLGMVLVDGADGYFAASMQRAAGAGGARAALGSRLLGVIVVVFAFGLGGAGLLGLDAEAIALPLGVALFCAVLSIRIWVRRSVLVDPHA
jgi:nickel/cobalt transporter (NiCoT) family protein